MLAAITVTVPVGQAIAQVTPEGPESAPAGAPPPARPLLYFFEHATLPEAAFRYDQDVQALVANPRQAGRAIARLFAKAGMRSVDVPTFNADTMLDDMRSFMRQISFETINRGGYTIHLMGMPPPEHPPEAYFVAIVYKDGEPLVEGQAGPSTRYITFEKASPELGAFALGEWNVDGNHTTHGFGEEEPTIRDFVGSVYAVLGIVGP